MIFRLVVLFFCCLIFSYHAYAERKVTFIHTDADGTPFAATDSKGNLKWRRENYPYGDKYKDTNVDRTSEVNFAGKAYDEEIGLSYFGARWYDPTIGRFTGIDAAPVQAENWRTFNRYSYGFNNPYKYYDPDGNEPAEIGDTDGDGDIDFRDSTFTPLSLGSSGSTEIGGIKVFTVGAPGFGGAANGKLSNTSKGAVNVANSSKLTNQLKLESANALFNKNGSLTQEAIKNSTKIIDSSQIKNSNIPKGFSKYSTKSAHSPSGNFQAHFYRNDKTGEVFYGQDFKSIFNSKSGG